MKPAYCTRCGSPVDQTSAYSEDGAIDYPWCERCMDYTDAAEKPPGHIRRGAAGFARLLRALVDAA